MEWDCTASVNTDKGLCGICKLGACIASEAEGGGDGRAEGVVACKLSIDAEIESLSPAR